MGDLLEDLRLEGGDGAYRGTVSGDWVVWTPNGGFLASLALRAAGLESPGLRPVSFGCHFLSVPRVAGVDLAVETLRASRRARSVRVSMRQEGLLILDALVWSAADSEDGLVHEIATMPDVPPPDRVWQWNPPADAPADDVLPFWRNMDARMVNWPEGQRWEQRKEADPIRLEWNRFRPRATFGDPFVDAARSLILIDTLMFPAAMMRYAEPMTHFAPSLDLSVWFHHDGRDEEWLLCEAVSPLAGRGLVGGAARVWTRDGRLVASGGQQMLARRIAPGPDPKAKMEIASGA